MKKTIAFSAAVITLCCSFGTMPSLFIREDADAELTVTDVKVKIIGATEFSFTQVNGNFYKRYTTPGSLSIHEKKRNAFVYVNDVPTMFSLTDSTYKMVDSTLNASVNSNFTWKFPDLSDSSTILQYTTTKPITRVSQFSLSGVSSVSKSSGFSYAHPLVQADSILYLLGADSLTSVKKMVYNQSYGVTYSSMELSGLTTTNEGTFMIFVFNTMPKTYNGKRYYFQNNSTAIVMPLPIN